MSKGFHSKIDLKETAREVVKESAAVSKEVYEAMESRGNYNSMTLDEQLSKQLQEMKNENKRLEELKQKEETKEEKLQTKERKSQSNEADYER